MKQKHKLVLEEGEAFVVLTAEIWRHLVGVFKALAEQYPVGSEENLTWLDLADNVSEQYTDTTCESEEDFG